MRIAAILNIIYCIILLSLPLVFAYTWIERVAEIDNDGTLLRAPGYIRGYGEAFVSTTYSTNIGSATRQPTLYGRN